ncbi:unnamed protein product, partial [Phaeothamnion confervicola]
DKDRGIIDSSGGNGGSNDDGGGSIDGNGADSGNGGGSSKGSGGDGGSNGGDGVGVGGGNEGGGSEGSGDGCSGDGNGCSGDGNGCGGGSGGGKNGGNGGGGYGAEDASGGGGGNRSNGGSSSEEIRCPESVVVMPAASRLGDARVVEGAGECCITSTSDQMDIGGEGLHLPAQPAQPSPRPPPTSAVVDASSAGEDRAAPSSRCLVDAASRPRGASQVEEAVPDTGSQPSEDLDQATAIAAAAAATAAAAAVVPSVGVLPPSSQRVGGAMGSGIAPAVLLAAASRSVPAAATAAAGPAPVAPPVAALAAAETAPRQHDSVIEETAVPDAWGTHRDDAPSQPVFVAGSYWEREEASAVPETAPPLISAVADAAAGDAIAGDAAAGDGDRAGGGAKSETDADDPGTEADEEELEETCLSLPLDPAAFEIGGGGRGGGGRGGGGGNGG